MKLLQGEETQTLHEGPLHLEREENTFLPGESLELKVIVTLFEFIVSHLSNVYSWVQAVANIHHYGGTQVLQGKHNIHNQFLINNNRIYNDSTFLCALTQFFRYLNTHQQDGIVSKERCNKNFILFIRVN